MAEYKDLSRIVFGRLIVLRRDGVAKDGALWLCVCACGKMTHASTNNLKRGHTKSCGCLRIDHYKKVTLNIKGKRFGRLVAKEYVGPSRSGHGAVWLFKCDCGREVKNYGARVARGNIRTCGCGVSVAASRRRATDEQLEQNLRTRRRQVIVGLSDAYVASRLHIPVRDLRTLDPIIIDIKRQVMILRRILKDPNYYEKHERRTGNAG